MTLAKHPLKPSRKPTTKEHAEEDHPNNLSAAIKKRAAARNAASFSKAKTAVQRANGG